MLCFCRWSEDIKLVELYIKLVEQSNVIDVPGLSYRNISSVASTAIGELVISFTHSHLLLPLCSLLSNNNGCRLYPKEDREEKHKTY